MVLKITAVLVASTLMGCSGAQSRVEEPEGALQSAEIEACDAAVAGLPASAAGDRADVLAEGCADLFRDPLCSEAIRMSPRAAPHLRAAMIALPCQYAYCDRLQPPRPELCELNVPTAAPSEISAAWTGFMSGALASDLQDERGASLGERLGPIFALSLLDPADAPSEPSAAPAPARRLIVRLAMEGTDYRVSAERDGEPSGSWLLPLPPDAGDLAGLLEASMRGCDDCGADVHSGAGVEFEVVTALIEVLEGEGFVVILAGGE